MPPNKPSSVPVVPNESIVQAQIVQITRDEDGQGWVWQSTVLSTRDVKGYPNFAKAYVGKHIDVYVQTTLRIRFSENDSFQAHIAYHGDERGGRFTLIENGIKKL
jgi:hypothetical protein